MKRILIIMTAMLITVASFAQMPVKKTVMDKTPVKIANQSSQVVGQQKNADASFWFSFTDALEMWWGEELEGFGPPLMCDSLGLFDFSGEMKPVQFMSLGQTYDWTHSCWTEFFLDQEAYEETIVPYLAETNSYSIDSVKLCYYYKRGTNVPDDVVDTIAISYILNIDNEPIRTLSNADGPAFSMLYLPYDENTFMADYGSCEDTDFPIVLGDEAQIVYQKIPLTAADSTLEDYFYYIAYECPEELSNVTCKKLAIAYTFIPGVERDLTSVIGEDISKFRTVMSDDVRPEYQEMGTEALLGDVQVGLFTDAENFNTESGWYGIYNPNMFWVGNPKPYLAFLTTCNDCAVVNVEDVEAEDMTVYPNPANNNITVNLAGEGEANIQLFNLVGQLVYSENAMNTTTINVSDLNAGVYMLKVNQNGKVYTSKVVVK